MATDCTLRFITFDEVVLRCTGWHELGNHLMSDLYIHKDVSKERQIMVSADDPCAWRAGNLMKGKK